MRGPLFTTASMCEHSRSSYSIHRARTTVSAMRGLEQVTRYSGSVSLPGILSVTTVPLVTRPSNWRETRPYLSYRYRFSAGELVSRQHRFVVVVVVLLLLVAHHQISDSRGETNWWDLLLFGGVSPAGALKQGCCLSLQTVPFWTKPRQKRI